MVSQVSGAAHSTATDQLILQQTVREKIERRRKRRRDYTDKTEKEKRGSHRPCSSEKRKEKI